MILSLASATLRTMDKRLRSYHKCANTVACSVCANGNAQNRFRFQQFSPVLLITGSQCTSLLVTVNARDVLRITENGQVTGIKPDIYIRKWKFQVLVYDILPPTTAIISDAIGLQKQLVVVLLVLKWQCL